ncbi:hypothetical protein CF098_07620 [Clostridium sporogenes]
MKIYDADIRKVLYDSFILNESFINDLSTKVIDEMDVCLGRSRVDIAVINGALHGFEIKSEQDTLERLPSQIESYNKIFDTLTIVACEKHIEKIFNIVPKWWGIYSVFENNGNLKLKKRRKVKINNNVDSLSLAELLWKDELLQLLSSNGIIKGTKSKTRKALCSIVVENIDNGSIKKFVKEKLKSRESWRAVPLKQLCDDLH